MCETDLLTSIIDENGLMSNKMAIIKLYNYLKKHIHPNLTPLNITLTSSGGSSVVLIPMFSRKAYQYYNHLETYQDIISLSQINKGCSNLVQLGVDRQLLPSKFQTIIWERLTPILSIGSGGVPQSISDRFPLGFPNIDKLIADITKSLQWFHSHGYKHGDCRLDNIGWRSGSHNLPDEYVLFDFNLSRESTSQAEFKKDYEMFAQSIVNNCVG